VAEVPENDLGYVRPVRRDVIHLHEDCNCQTRMTVGHAELLALNPQHFTSLYCANHNALFPVSEFVWSVDHTVVGT